MPSRHPTSSRCCTLSLAVATPQLRAAARAAAAAAMLAGAVWPAAAGAASEPPAPGLQECRLRGLEHPAWCGTLSRPLSAAAPAGQQITLHYAVLPGLARQREPDPVFFFAGGPGQSAIDLAGPVAQLLARLSNRRDLVLIDQRGTGRSAPLDCAEDDAPTRPLAQSLDAAAAQRELQQCLDGLQRLPYGDLRHFTTVDAAGDAEAVRMALGAPQINLIGVSYGTRVALEYMRQAPQAVRRAVLDGVAPPDMALPVAFARDAQAAFNALLAWCAGDAACHARHPRLAAHWQALWAGLPRPVTLVHPVTGQAENLTLTREAVAALVRAPLYAPALAAGLPLAIEEAAGGRWSALVGLAQSMGGGSVGRIAQGQHFAVLCSEDMPRALAQPAPTGPFATLAQRYGRLCADWPRAELPPAFYRIAAAPAPVLLLSGAFDPVTPPEHAQRVAAALGARARHVVIPAAGHGQLGLPCVREQVFRFVDASDEAGALAAAEACRGPRPRPPVFVPPGAAEGGRR